MRADVPVLVSLELRVLAEKTSELCSSGGFATVLLNFTTISLMFTTRFKIWVLWFASSSIWEANYQSPLRLPFCLLT